MKISQPELSAINPSNLTSQSKQQSLGGNLIKSFSDVLSDTKIQSILQRGLSAKSISPADLIQAQVAIGRYQLKTELITKCAEGINATLRRIQQGS
jgi:hypothetical protein